MQLKWKGKAIYEYSLRRLTYALCFFLFCVIDQRVKTCTGLDGWLETFRDLTGVGMAVIILSHYRWEEIRRWKLPYIIWTVISVVGGAAALLWGSANRPYFNDWIVVVLDVILFGYILIHTAIDLIWEKKYPRLDKRFLLIWAVLLLWMMISRSTYIWPLCYLIMFGCFYLTDFTAEEKKDLFQGMLDGIILGFFVLQGLCFVFRPYDLVRYQGIYHNSNLNSLFYLEVLAAVLAKLVYVTKHACSKWIRVYYMLGAGVVLSFELMTIGRAGWLAAALLVFVFLWMMKKLAVVKKVWIRAVAILLCMVITFPLCFSASRYLPPVFHHPIWFWGEWSEARVHSWDPWDSEKYIDIDEYVDAAVGRILKSLEDVLEHSPLVMRVEASELPANRIPVISVEQAQDSLLVRGTIYRYYLQKLNWTGHPYEEQGFLLHEGYWIGHAHNIFLQYGTDFGIPALLLFFVLSVWAIVKAGKYYKKGQSPAAAGALLFLLVPVLFGMFEYSWGVGSLSILTMFVSWRTVICDGAGEE